MRFNKEFADACTVEDKGNNRSDMIDKVESVWGLKGLPYCAMGQFYSFAKAYLTVNNIDYTADNIVAKMKKYRDDINKLVFFSPACQDMINVALGRGTFVPVRNTYDLNKMVAGDYVFFNFGTETKHENHIGQFLELSGESMITVEWNTSGVNSEVKEKGKETNDALTGGVYVKKRAIHVPQILGYIHW